MIVAAVVMNEHKSLYGGTMDRDLYVMDAFEEIPTDMYRRSSGYLRTTEKQVRENFELLDISGNEDGASETVTVHFKKDLFQHTAPTLATDSVLENIAVLRIDGNFYDSYQDALYYGYPKVPVGGIIIFDDVFNQNIVMNCWNDFKAVDRKGM
mmetsp:Transcript_33325/g.37875  ORF Transcript_33325/g.37875 Transcript_33325/m.37875 type:complete len:153 (-) Transcript_33325:28-486(-)